jgi:CubicO group peptidase (beta-lactamase class C family)
LKALKYCPWLIKLAAVITTCLPHQYWEYIDKASSMTVSNLLNHTSGMTDYLQNPSYFIYALDHPEYTLPVKNF